MNIKVKCDGVLIFSGYNPRATFSFLRTLVKNSVPFGIIASGKNDKIFLTKYKDNVLVVRSSKIISQK